MPNIRDYLTWRGDLTFAQSEFNEVDNLILTELTYLNFSEVVPGDFSACISLADAARLYFEKRPYTKNALGLLLPDEIQDLLKEAAATPRFAGVLLRGYADELDEAEEKQFAALTFDLTEELRFISFRGTDDSLVGWKEDCNMSFRYPVPSQVRALEYLTAAAEPGKILLAGGHSKGGNLAMYAAAHCGEEIFRRIRMIYNNDGPGFATPEIAGSVFQRLEGRLLDTVPEASIVGLLMEFRDQFQFVKSDARGPMQHDGLSWQVKGPAFDKLAEEPKAVKRKKRTLRAWIQEMDFDQREAMVENLFAFRKNITASTLLELHQAPAKTLAALISSYDQETRGVLEDSFKLLLREETSTLQQSLREERENFKQSLNESVQNALDTLRSLKESPGKTD